MQNRIPFAVFLISLFTSACTPQPSSSGTASENIASRPPNIILMVADDLGYGHLGAYGQSQIRTPNLDRMASEGIRFTHFYAGSTVCAPSRSALMEGLTTGNTYIRGNVPYGKVNEKEIASGIGRFEQLYRQDVGQQPLPEESITIAEMLKARGYRTAMVGKWGLGSAENSGAPNAQGFDYFYGLSDQRRAHNHFPSHVWLNRKRLKTINPYFIPHKKFSGDPGNLDSSEYKFGLESEWIGDLIADKSVQFMEKSRHQPFFLYVPFVAPHTALQAPKEAIAEYANSFQETPYISDGEGGYLSRRNPRAVYAAMITRTDVNAGRILKAVERLGLADNTLILFTSDNGPAQEGGEDVEFFNASGPLRGIKRDLYEGGIRVPLIAKWPGVIPASTVSLHVGAFWDVLPTLADISDQPYSGQTDGISFVPSLTGKGKQLKHKALYWEFHEQGGKQAVRMGEWKGIRLNVKNNPHGPIELYNLASDPGEAQNVAEKYPSIVADIDRHMREARSPSWHSNWNFKQ